MCHPQSGVVLSVSTAMINCSNLTGEMFAGATQFLVNLHVLPFKQDALS